MSIYDTDHLGQPTEGYLGPFTSFWDNAKASYEQQYRVDSFSALEAEAGEMWLPSIREYERVTGKMADVSFSDASMRTYISAVMGVDTPWTSKGANDAQSRQHILQLNEQIKALNNPNIKSLDQIVQDVIAMRAEVSGQAANVAARTNWTGWLGSVAGGVAGSFSTRDPLQLLTLGFGGFGKSLGMRLLTEAGIGGAVETGQQFLGVQPTRELLGEEPGNPWESIAFAAIGAAGIRGGLEGLGSAGRYLSKRLSEGPTVDAFDLTDSQMRQMFERQDTPTSRAGEHALDAQQQFNALNPYTPTDVGMRRFIGELSEVQELMAGRTATAIRQLPVEQMPVDLDNLSFEMAQVKETQPVVYQRFAAAQNRLSEIDQQIIEAQTSLASITEADGIQRFDQDTADLVRSYQQDLETGTPAQREQAQRQLNALAETLGPERIARETVDAGITPRQQLKTLRASRRAAAREYKAARDAVDKVIERNEQSARLKEMVEQQKSVANVGLYAKQNPEPYIGPELQHHVVEASYEAATTAQDEIPVAARNVTTTPEGLFDLGDGTTVAPDFAIELVDDAGNARTMSAREIFEDLDEDDRLVTAMSECAL